MRLHTALVLLLAACNGKDTGDTGPGDTDPVEDTDTDVIFEDNYKGFVGEISGVPKEPRTAIALVNVDLSSGEPVLGTTWKSIPLSGGGTFTIGLEAEGPPAADVADVAAHPGLRASLYFPLLYVDEDQNNVLDEGEIIPGVNLDKWLGWYEGTIPSGFPTGWSLVTPDLSNPSADPTFAPLGTEAEITYRGGASIVELEGTWTNPPLRGGIVAIQRVILDGGTPSDSHALDEELVAGAYDVDIEMRPAGDHYDTSNPDLWVASEVLLGYEDLDYNGKYEAEKDRLTRAGVCWDGNPIFLRYIQPPNSLAGAIALEQAGWASGWRASLEDGTELSSMETEFTTVDEAGCTLDF